MTHYILSGVAVVILSWALQGCRFGSNIEKNAVMDPLTGWYETEIASLQFVARHGNGTVQTSPDFTFTPNELAGVLTNPVAFVTNPAKPEQAKIISGFYDPEVFNYIVTADVNQKITFVETESYLTESGSKCKMNFEFNGNGSLVSQKHTITVEGKEVATLGRLEMNMNRLIVLEGDCEQELNRMAWCYKDIKACELQGFAEPQKRQDTLKGIFDPYINAGVMTAEDIATVVEMGYDAVYR